MRLTPWLPATACVVSLAAVMGCGGRGAPPGTIRVTGSVTHAGQPLPDGSLHFAPVGHRGGAAVRIAKGRFQAHLAPGRYRVAVISTEGREQIDPKTGGPVPGKSRVPERYLSADTSGLEVLVDESHRVLTLAIGP